MIDRTNTGRTGQYDTVLTTLLSTLEHFVVFLSTHAIHQRAQRLFLHIPPVRSSFVYPFSIITDPLIAKLIPKISSSLVDRPINRNHSWFWGLTRPHASPKDSACRPTFYTHHPSFSMCLHAPEKLAILTWPHVNMICCYVNLNHVNILVMSTTTCPPHKHSTPPVTHQQSLTRHPEHVHHSQHSILPLPCQLTSFKGCG